MRVLLAVPLVALLATAELAAQDKGDAPATLRVLLPARATLTINGAKTTQTTADRLFETPPLTSGKTYTFTLKATFTRSGSTVSIERKVAIQAGQKTTVSLDAPVSTGSLYRTHYENVPGRQPPVNVIAQIEHALEDDDESPDDYQLYNP